MLTQFMQFFLGYTPLQAGVRAGLVLIATGLWQISTATMATTYAGTVLGMVLLGAGAGLAIPAATGSVIGSAPESDSVGGRGHAGLARGAFISGMDLGLLTAAVVALAGAVAALAWLPRRSGREKAL